MILTNLVYAFKDEIKHPFIFCPNWISHIDKGLEVVVEISWAVLCFFILWQVHLLTLEEEKFMITIALWKWLMSKIIKTTFFHSIFCQWHCFPSLFNTKKIMLLRRFWKIVNRKFQVAIFAINCAVLWKQIILNNFLSSSRCFTLRITFQVWNIDSFPALSNAMPRNLL